MPEPALLSRLGAVEFLNSGQADEAKILSSRLAPPTWGWPARRRSSCATWPCSPICASSTINRSWRCSRTCASPSTSPLTAWPPACRYAVRTLGALGLDRCRGAPAQPAPAGRVIASTTPRRAACSWPDLVLRVRLAPAVGSTPAGVARLLQRRPRWPAGCPERRGASQRDDHPRGSAPYCLGGGADGFLPDAYRLGGRKGGLRPRHRHRVVGGYSPGPPALARPPPGVHCLELELEHTSFATTATAGERRC